MRQKGQVPPSFTAKKDTILASLSTPESDYTDLSPKGSVDAAIKPLIDRINALDGVVTTSSCAGRVSVFLEGRKLGKGLGERGDAKENEGLEKESAQAAVPGGKGLGGRWLFVSHEPVELPKKAGEKHPLSRLLGLGSRRAQSGALPLSGDVNEMRLVRFQFEPMVCTGSGDEISSFFKIQVASTMMLQLLRRNVDPSHNDRFSIPCPTNSCSSHQCWFSRKRNSEPQKLGRYRCLSYGCYSDRWPGLRIVGRYHNKACTGGRKRGRC